MSIIDFKGSVLESPNEEQSPKQEIDISVVGPINESMKECIKLCISRNITCEVVNKIENCKGIFICLANENIYYNDYFLALQFSTLFVYPKYSSYRFPLVINYSTSPTKKFYLVENFDIYFWRRTSKVDESIYYDTSGILPGCVYNSKEPRTHGTFDRTSTEKYKKFFVNKQ